VVHLVVQKEARRPVSGGCTTTRCAVMRARRRGPVVQPVVFDRIRAHLRHVLDRDGQGADLFEHHTGAPAFSAYSASKAAVHNLARTWAEDPEGSGIPVNVRRPDRLRPTGQDGPPQAGGRLFLRHGRHHPAMSRRPRPSTRPLADHLCEFKVNHMVHCQAASTPRSPRSPMSPDAACWSSSADRTHRSPTSPNGSA
jgi:NAD(P)-dependent dehydrogenase (short-subunit alcohol dehydrogenase family)